MPPCEQHSVAVLDRSRFTRFRWTLVSIPQKDGSAPVLANLTGLPEGSLSDSRHKLRNAHLVFATNRETKTLRGEIRLKQACGKCCGKRFLKGLPKQGGRS
jgi:hypothetical protein